MLEKDLFELLAEWPQDIHYLYTLQNNQRDYQKCWLVLSIRYPFALHLSKCRFLNTTRNN